MLKKVEDYIKKTDMLKRYEKVLIGCSGGPDSVALLYILYDLSKKWKWKLAVFYLNHGIRNQAVLEARFVEKLSEKFSLPFYRERIDAVNYSKTHKLSLEEGARILRYNTFEKVKEEISADRVALGHNLNDNVETFFIRLFQGSGIGLSGIQPVSGYIVRPLLILRKDEILKFLQDNNIDYLTDISNYSNDFLRNKIRWDIIPYIESVFPDVLKAISRSAQNISDITLAVKEILKKEVVIKEKRKWVSIERNKFFSLPEGARFMLMKLSLEKLGIENVLKRAHIDEINTLKEKTGEIKISEGTIYIGKEIFIFRDDYFKVGNEKELKIPGSTTFGNFIIKTKSINRIPNIRNGSFYFDLRRIALPLSVRFRKPGDRIIPFGMHKEKKLKAIFIDKKTPRPIRNMYPVIEDKNGILIGAETRANRARITEKTSRILKISIEEWEKNSRKRE